MTSYLIDINLWLAISWEQHVHYARAVAWYESVGQARLWFCRFTMLGMLRLLTNQRVMGDDMLSLAEAWDVYDDWRQDPRVDLIPEPPGIEPMFRQATAPFSKVAASNVVADCYLVGFAQAAGARVVTFDKGLARTAQLRKVPVTLLQPQ